MGNAIRKQQRGIKGAAADDTNYAIQFNRYNCISYVSSAESGDDSQEWPAASVSTTSNNSCSSRTGGEVDDGGVAVSVLDDSNTDPESKKRKNNAFRAKDSFDSFGVDEKSDLLFRRLVVPEPQLDLEHCPRILTDSMIEQLQRDGLATGGCTWERCFAIGRDGDSYITLLDRCAPYQQTLLAVRTTAGDLLGGFAARAWKIQDGRYRKKNSYYGNGQSFLFANRPQTEGFEHLTLSSGRNINDNDSLLHLYKWTGSNDYCQICDAERKRLAMGGVGDFGLILSDNFWRGETGYCSTFANPPLVKGGRFEIQAFEVYGLVPLFQSINVRCSTVANNNIETKQQQEEGQSR